jgi:HAD superfamily hydrolase (TIGR01509 family)
MTHLPLSREAILFPGAGVIFDMDGLLLDTEVISRSAWQRAAHEAGFEISDKLFQNMIGRGKRDCAGYLEKILGPGFNFDEIYRQCNIYDDHHVDWYGLPVKPGAFELVETLFARRVPLAVATSTHLPKATRRLEQVGLFGYFATVVAGNEIARGKPAPDIYLEAARRLAIDPAQSFAVEDSMAGVRAAHAAGLKVIMVPDLVQPTEEIAALTDRVAVSLREVMALLPAR